MILKVTLEVTVGTEFQCNLLEETFRTSVHGLGGKVTSFFQSDQVVVPIDCNLADVGHGASLRVAGVLATGLRCGSDVLHPFRGDAHCHGQFTIHRSTVFGQGAICAELVTEAHGLFCGAVI